MSSERVETITLSKAIPGHAPGHHRDSFIVGSNHSDDQGRRYVRLGLEDTTGERDIEVFERDTCDFAGAMWQVTKIFAPVTQEPIDDPDSSFSRPDLRRRRPGGGIDEGFWAGRLKKRGQQWWAMVRRLMFVHPDGEPCLQQ